MATKKQKFIVFMNKSGQAVDPAEAYANRVLATSPLRYNKLNEGSGSAIVDSSGNSYTGTYTGVTWDGTLSPVGEPMPFFDGVNDLGNIYSASFASAFNMDEFTVMVWLKVNSAGVWTDATQRWSFRLLRDVNNLVQVFKSSNNNTMTYTRVGNATTKTQNVTGFNETGLLCVALSGSIAGGGLLSAGDMRFYKNGVQAGTTQTGNLATTGTGLQTNSAVIGAIAATGGAHWHGYKSQFAIWNRPMDNDILALMTV